MIKLFSLKQQKKDGEANTPSSSTGSQKRASPAQLRIMKGMILILYQLPINCQVDVNITLCLSLDLNELNLPKTCTTEFPDPDDIINYKLAISPDEGFYKGGKFVFNFKVGPSVSIVKDIKKYYIENMK